MNFSPAYAKTLFTVTLIGDLFAMAPAVQAAPRPATILSGSVIVRRKNLRTTTTLHANDSLNEGDVIATGATNASLQFNDGSKVDMSSESAIEITKPAAVGQGKLLLRALNGRVSAHLRPDKVIATRTAMIRVKGTEIIITIADDGTTTLEVLGGAAEFFSPCGQVLVGAGQKSQAPPGQAPTTPSEIPNLDTLLKEWQLKGISTEAPPGTADSALQLTFAVEPAKKREADEPQPGTKQSAV